MSDIEETKVVTEPVNAADAAPVDAAKAAEIMEKFEKESRTRTFGRVYRRCVCSVYRFRDDFGFFNVGHL